jgi:hypothetical protein
MRRFDECIILSWEFVPKDVSFGLQNAPELFLEETYWISQGCPGFFYLWFLHCLLESTMMIRKVNGAPDFWNSPLKCKRV